MDKQGIRIQEIVADYFENTDNETLVSIIESFVYNLPAEKEGISKIIEKFIEDNELTTAYVNYLSDIKKQKFFLSSAPSERYMIQDIKHAMLNLSFNRLRNGIYSAEKLKKESNSKNKNNFNFIKKTLLQVFSSFNNNESYFYGKKEDAKIVEKIKSMDYE